VRSLSRLALTLSEINDKGNTMKFYRKVLDMGRSKKRCIGCDRAIHANEKSHFEAYVSIFPATAC
jgi:hypothetical protein